jgi:hypothetical protein
MFHTKVLCKSDDKYTQTFTWKPEGKRLLERPGHKWEDNIKLDLKETGCGLK